MNRLRPDFAVDLARSAADLHAVQRLRYKVFVAELGGTGPGTDNSLEIEADEFDPVSEHLVLRDLKRLENDQIVGVYRLMTEQNARDGRGFYSDAEYDLSCLRDSRRPMLELGRSCLHRDYRGGDAMFHLWAGLSKLVAERNVELLFGVASFHGTDPDAIGQPLSLLHHEHLAPPDLRVTSRAPVTMDRFPRDQIDRLAALRDIPALIKAYLRLGGVVGEGAFIDRAFNTIDVCLILDIARMNERQLRIYAGAGA